MNHENEATYLVRLQDGEVVVGCLGLAHCFAGRAHSVEKRLGEPGRPRRGVHSSSLHTGVGATAMDGTASRVLTHRRAKSVSNLVFSPIWAARSMPASADRRGRAGVNVLTMHEGAVVIGLHTFMRAAVPRSRRSATKPRHAQRVRVRDPLECFHELRACHHPDHRCRRSCWSIGLCDRQDTKVQAQSGETPERTLTESKRLATPP